MSGLFRFIGVCSFQREHRYYALEITCCHACELDCRRVRFAKPSGCIQSIQLRFHGIMSIALASGFYLFSRFISKIPSLRVHYTYTRRHYVASIVSSVSRGYRRLSTELPTSEMYHAPRAFGFNEIRLTRRNATNRSFGSNEKKRALSNVDKSFYAFINTIFSRDNLSANNVNKFTTYRL